jgi:hypothetical protein
VRARQGMRTVLATAALGFAILGGCASTADPREAAYLTLFEPGGDATAKDEENTIKSIEFAVGPIVCD